MDRLSKFAGMTGVVSEIGLASFGFGSVDRALGQEKGTGKPTTGTTYSLAPKPSPLVEVGTPIAVRLTSTSNSQMPFAGPPVKFQAIRGFTCASEGVVGFCHVAA